MPRGEARILADRLLGHRAGTAHMLGEVERSVVCEVANTLTGAYLGALLEATGLRSDLGPPAIAEAPAVAVFSEASVMAGAEPDSVILVEIVFHVQDSQLSAWLFILSAPEAMERAICACGAR